MHIVADCHNADARHTRPLSLRPHAAFVSRSIAVVHPSISASCAGARMTTVHQQTRGPCFQRETDVFTHPFLPDMQRLLVEGDDSGRLKIEDSWSLLA